MLATAPSGKAIGSIIGGIGANGQLLVIAGAPDATELALASLIGGNRSIQGCTGSPDGPLYPAARTPSSLTFWRP